LLTTYDQKVVVPCECALGKPTVPAVASLYNILMEGSDGRGRQKKAFRVKFTNADNEKSRASLKPFLLLKHQ
jgi:hypothetical protein